MLYNLFENRDFVSVFAVALLAEGVDRNIREQLDGKSLVIEDAACKLKQWLTGEIHPYWVEVESDVTDGVHGHVTVTV